LILLEIQIETQAKELEEQKTLKEINEKKLSELK
jgi:hypothetical protein